MNLLFIGDVVGKGGCECVQEKLYALKKDYDIGLTIINAENSAVGNGVTPASADSLLDYGADVLTLGNHSLRRREIYSYLDSPNNPIIRPYNYHHTAPGRGSIVIEKGANRIGIINLLGMVGMDSVDNPFNSIDEAVSQLQHDGCNIILVDFHAEASGEKRAMGFYLDGRVSAVLGTHTHVPTADEQILPHGTGYITDVGMTGPIDSCLGVRKELAIEKMKTLLPVRFENPESACALQGVVLTIDTDSGKCTHIERIEVK